MSMVPVQDLILCCQFYSPFSYHQLLSYLIELLITACVNWKSDRKNHGKKKKNREKHEKVGKKK